MLNLPKPTRSWREPISTPSNDSITPGPSRLPTLLPVASPPSLTNGKAPSRKSTQSSPFISPSSKLRSRTDNLNALSDEELDDMISRTSQLISSPTLNGLPQGGEVKIRNHLNRVQTEVINRSNRKLLDLTILDDNRIIPDFTPATQLKPSPRHRARLANATRLPTSAKIKSMDADTSLALEAREAQRIIEAKRQAALLAEQQDRLHRTTGTALRDVLARNENNSALLDYMFFNEDDDEEISYDVEDDLDEELGFGFGRAYTRGYDSGG